MSSETLTLVDRKGAPQARVKDPHGRLKESLGSYRILSSLPNLLVLQREEEPGEDRGRGHVLMAGEVLADTTILDVVNVIVASRWAGTLHVHGPDAHRAFGFDRGVLRHATSDHPEDRLDKVLFRIGVLTPALAETVMRELKPHQRFGEVLVERGLIDRKDLFRHLQSQMEEIFFSAALESEGGYLFQVADDASPAPTLLAHIPAQQLLFHAAERTDRVREFQRLIPDESMRPEVLPGVDLAQLKPRSRLVLGYCDGKRSVREIASETWLGRFHTLRIVHGFLQQDRVRLFPPTRTTRELALGLVAPCDRALREIWKAVEDGSDIQRLRRELAEKIDENEYRHHLRGVVRPDGGLDSEKISTWLSSLQIRDRQEVVEHTLHELTSFALFFASLTLPRDAERELAKKVNQHLQGSVVDLGKLISAGR